MLSALQILSQKGGKTGLENLRKMFEVTSPPLWTLVALTNHLNTKGLLHRETFHWQRIKFSSLSTLPLAIGELQAIYVRLAPLLTTFPRT